MNRLKLMPDQSIELFKTRCRARGLKLTPQRLLIYETLLRSTEHPTADGIYRALKPVYPSISIDTVHRTLDTFCDLGLASMVEGTGIPKRFEGNLQRHHHARCVKCDTIMDFTHPAYDQLEAPAELQQVFQILRQTVHFEGLCQACQTAPAISDPPTDGDFRSGC